MGRGRHPTYTARRDALLAATYDSIAEHGWAGATTADIARRAGLSASAFFHYFPAKLDALVALLHQGVGETVARAGAYAEDEDPLAVVMDYLSRCAAETALPGYPRFVTAVSTLTHLPEISTPLAAEADAQHDFLVRRLLRAQQAGQVRPDWHAEKLARWVAILLEGFQAAADPDADRRATVEELLEVIDRMLRPDGP